jgi:hypothetical protein
MKPNIITSGMTSSGANISYDEKPTANFTHIKIQLFMHV